mgnify:CR=1 FL=1
MKFNITDKELTKIMKNLVILCDTREKDNQAIISYFENKNIKNVLQKIIYFVTLSIESVQLLC